MSLRQRIETDVVQGMKDKNELVVLVLRGVKTAVGNFEIAKRPEPITEDDVLKVLRSEVKKRKDAVVLYRQGGRPELAEKELAEIAIVETYLPPAIDESIVRQAVVDAIAELGATTPAELGKVMGAAMGKLKGQAVDGTVVSRIAKEVLTSAPSA